MAVTCFSVWVWCTWRLNT